MTKLKLGITKSQQWAICNQVGEPTSQANIKWYTLSKWLEQLGHKIGSISNPLSTKYSLTLGSWRSSMNIDLLQATIFHLVTYLSASKVLSPIKSLVEPAENSLLLSKLIRIIQTIFHLDLLRDNHIPSCQHIRFSWWCLTEQLIFAHTSNNDFLTQNTPRIFNFQFIKWPGVQLCWLARYKLS